MTLLKNKRLPLARTKRNKRVAVLALFGCITLVFTFVLLFDWQMTKTFAADPSSGTLSAAGAPVTWTGTLPGGAAPDGPATCIEGTNCETYTLTLSGTPADWSGKLARVKIVWATPASDYDMYIYQGSLKGTEIGRSAQGPSTFESVNIDPSATGTGVYAVQIVHFATVAVADQYKGTASVEAKSTGGTAEVPPTSTATPPTYTIFPAPATNPTGAASDTNLGSRAGEPTVGLNWSTGRAMFIASLQTLQVTFGDSVSPATATWVQKSAPNTDITSFDPLLFTDSKTNRTFVSQLLPSKISLMSYTDDDGENWTPSQGAGINSGVDHQTIGGGPYARNSDGSLKGGAIQKPGPNLQIYPNAVYYASQDIAVAELARSDDGGFTFGVAVPMYDLTQCGGLHGHIKVAPDGTVYVPNKGCGNEQAVVVSEDNGMTWNVRKIPGSKRGHSDPSLGIGSDGTIYVGYSDGDSKARVAVSRDKGLTWENNQDVGFRHNVQNSVFPAVTAGDGDRAAFFFLGTTTPGSAGTSTDQTSPYFNGVWNAYIATTYDRGKTWVTVNATPNDPVQRGVICTNGTTCPSGTRNLLDFNDLEVDKQGRAVAAFADGCVTAQCKQGIDKNADGQLNTRFDNDGARLATIIRQSGGKGLFAAFDPPPAAPQSLTASAQKNTGQNVFVWLNWVDKSDNEQNFVIERSRTSDFASKVSITVGANATAYTDKDVASRTTYYYRIKAVSSNGSSGFSNVAQVLTK